MNKGRLLLAGVLAGLAIFVWGMISHMALTIGEISVKALPNESAVLTCLNQNVKEPGFYLYPVGGMMDAQKGSKEQQEAARKQYEELYKTSPSGVLVLTPPTGQTFNFPKLLVNEFVSNLLSGIIAAWLLSLALGGLPSFVGRVVFVALLGFGATLAIDFSYWNWYGFPTKYLCASFLDNTLGFALAGVVLAWMFRQKAKA
jgi:hypothetical protein